MEANYDQLPMLGADLNDRMIGFTLDLRESSATSPLQDFLIFIFHLPDIRRYKINPFFSYLVSC